MFSNHAVRGVVGPCLCVSALAALLVPAGAARAQGLVLNELSVSPPRGYPQFIEVHNPSSRRIELGGWRISGTAEHFFPPAASIEARGFLVLASDAGEFEAAYGFPPDGRFSGFFLEDEAAVLLTSPAGTIESKAILGLDPASLARGGGATLELIAPELDGTDASSWAPSKRIGGTPGAENSRRRRLRVDPVIPRRASWRYVKGIAEPPGDALAWTRPEYDDTSWQAGVQPIGFGNLDDGTTLDDMRGSYSTVYARLAFQARGAAAAADATFWVVYDDGFIAYLNGRELVRRNMGPAGSPRPHDAPAEGRQENEGIPEEHHLALEAGTIHDGMNVLALQAANDHVRGSDFSIHAALTLAAPVEAGEAAPPLLINEAWLEEPGGPEAGFGIEVFNAGRADVPLEGLRLISANGLGSASLPGGSLSAGGFIAVSAPPAFLSGKVILARSGDGLISDAAELRGASAGGSWGRFPDGRGALRRLPAPTPSSHNLPPVAGDVVITEIHYHPLDPDEEFVEIRAVRAVDLGGWALAGAVRFGFAPGTSLDPGEHLAIGRSPDLLNRLHGGIRALGPFQGRLDNAADELILVDANGIEVDRVRYADDGSWPAAADGAGSSIELVDPSRENDAGAAWAVSATPGGTPGRANGAFRDSAPPLITLARHEPLVPRPGEIVTISARIEPAGAAADLHWRVDGASEPTRVPMTESHGLHAAAIAAPDEGTIVEYWIEAKLSPGSAETSRHPAAPPGTCLYQVDTKVPSPLIESYRLIIRSADKLRIDADVTADVLVPAAFIARDAAFQDVVVRYRGSGSRLVDPRSWNVRFTDDRPFEGMTRMFLNGFRPERQVLGMDVWRRAAMPYSRAKMVQLNVNGILYPRYARMEPIDEGYLARHFGSGEGNLYRGRETADLAYLGPDPTAYETLYEKESNEETSDWSEIIELTRAFAEPEDGLFAAAISRLIDTEEWARWLALNTVLSNQEGGLHRDTGDDYYIYRPPGGRFVLLPWDMDSTFLEPEDIIFRTTVPAVRRFLTHPRFAPLYHRELERAAATYFHTRSVSSAIALIEPAEPDEIDDLMTFVKARSGFLEESVPSRLTAGIAGGGWGSGAELYADGSTVRLEGAAPAASTAGIRVAGLPAAYEPWKGAWTRDLELSSQETLIRIEAVDESGGVIAEMDTLIRRLDGTRPITSLPPGRTTWGREGSPHIVAASLRIDAGSELIVEDGARVLVPAGGVLQVAGTLRVAGTSSRRISFSGSAPGGAWGGIVIEPGATAEISHADFQGEPASATAVPSGPLISGDRASVTVRSSTFRSIPAVAIEVTDGFLEVSDCEFASTREAIHGVRSTVLASRNVIDRTLGDADGIDLDGDPPPSRPESSIEENTIIGVGDDGIDLLVSSAVIRGNWIISAADRGISIEGAGTPLVEGNIVASCSDGIALKDGTDAQGGHNTLTGSAIGLRAFRKDPAAPSASGSFHSSIIWGNGTDIVLESGSALAIDHSDIGRDPGAWGPSNFSADPLFAGRADFRLGAGSPCAAAGRGGSPAGARRLAEPGSPEIIAVDPPSGPASGGNRVTIAGTGLEGAIEARVGGRLLLRPVLTASGAIRGDVPPAGHAGAADVEVLTTTGTATAPAGYRYVLRLLRGDADGDLRLSVTDALVIIQGLFGGGELPPCREALDLTGDSVVDLSDVLHLLEYIFAGGAPPDGLLVDCD